MARLRDLLINRWWSPRGWRIHLRVEAPAFVEALRRIHRLIDEDKFAEARAAIEEAGHRWDPNDPSLIRAESIVHFGEMEVDDAGVRG